MGTVVRYEGAGGVGFAIDDAALPARAEALEKLSGPSAGAQRAAVKHAFSNDPFEDYPRVVVGYKRLFEGEEKERKRPGSSYNQAVEGFLRRTFHSLTFIPQMSFDTTNISESVERKALNTALVRYRAAKMERQARLLKNAYDGLRALRIVLGGVWQKNLVETVVPSRFLPELLVSAPVWFIEKKKEESERNSDRDTIRFFCDLCETDQFAYLFQIYNCKVRLFTDFCGRDIMPLPLVDLVREVRNLFDYLVIATPYHDIAAKEWEEMPWTSPTRKVDPFLFGFLKEVPEWMFFLGRWSGTGLFPRIGEMIAGTAEHLEKGKALLSTVSDRLVWYKTGYRVDLENVVVGPHLRPVESYQMPKTSMPRSRREEEKWRKQNHSLVKFEEILINKFGNGALFSWLRGESA